MSLKIRVVIGALWLVGFIGAWGVSFYEHINLDFLTYHEYNLRLFAHQHMIQASIAYGLLSLVVGAFSLPGSMVVAFGGGFVLGPVLSVPLFVTGMSAGMSIQLSCLKTALYGGSLSLRHTRWGRFQQGFQRYVLAYLLFCRLIPWIPFAVVNVWALAMGAGVARFFVATWVGLVPITVVYAVASQGFFHYILNNQEFDFQGVLSDDVAIALCGVALMALIPAMVDVLMRRRQQKKNALKSPQVLQEDDEKKAS